MRFLSGLIVGTALTIGTAYMVDAMHSGPGDDQAPKMVNWTVVDANVRDLSADVQHGWARLMNGAKAIDRKTGI